MSVYEPNPGNSSGFLATYTFSEIYNLVAKDFVESAPKYPLDAMPIFIKRVIPMHTGNIRQFDEEDFSSFAKQKPEGVAAAKGAYGIGYYKQMTMYRIALELDLTYESRMFDRWNDVSKIGQKLAKTAPYRINLDMTHKAVTFAAGTSYVNMDGFTVDTTTGDGLSIANAAHTLAFSTATYTNIVPGAPQFSKSALISAETIAKNNTVDNYNIPGVMNFTHIWCANTPNLTENILQFLRSISDNTQANPNVENTYRNKYKMLVLSQLDTDAFGQRDTSKSNWWGIGAFGGEIAGDRFQAYYGEWEPSHMKPNPVAGSNADDFSKDIWKYGVRAGYGLAVVSGRGMIYSFAS